VAEKSALAPAAMDDGPLTVSVKWLPGVIVALALREGSATLLAVSTMIPGDGMICGAVKTPLASTVPQAAPLQPGPLKLQTTAVLGFPAETMPA